MIKPALHVITGPMFSGKSDELIRQIKLARIAKIGVLIVKPERDTRYKNCVGTRNGEQRIEAHVINSPKAILELLEPHHDIIAIDEAQFFDISLVKVVKNLLRQHKRVIVSGLNLQFNEEPWETTMHLLALATEITLLKNVCGTCHSFDGDRSQRLSDSEEAIVIGDKGEYDGSCLVCFTPSPQRKI